MNKIEVRSEVPGDFAEISIVNEKAFGNDRPSRLIEALREEGALLFSLVALWDRERVGHISFSAATISENDVFTSAIVLAPLAVKPEFQRNGVGSALARAGLAKAREAGWEIAVVLGHPAYYPRFGFRSASERGITYREREVGDALQVMELQPGALNSVRGVVDVHPAFKRTGCA
jgi:putative acetyltransferase